MSPYREAEQMTEQHVWLTVYTTVLKEHATREDVRQGWVWWTAAEHAREAVIAFRHLHTEAAEEEARKRSGMDT